MQFATVMPPTLVHSGGPSRSRPGPRSNTPPVHAQSIANNSSFLAHCLPNRFSPHFFLEETIKTRKKPREKIWETYHFSLAKFISKNRPASGTQTGTNLPRRSTDTHPGTQGIKPSSSETSKYGFLKEPTNPTPPHDGEKQTGG